MAINSTNLDIAKRQLWELKRNVKRFNPKSSNMVFYTSITALESHIEVLQQELTTLRVAHTLHNLIGVYTGVCDSIVAILDDNGMVFVRIINMTLRDNHGNVTLKHDAVQFHTPFDNIHLRPCTMYKVRHLITFKLSRIGAIELRTNLIHGLD